jgi:hypothetical protein
MGHRLDRAHPLRLRFLVLIKPLNGGVRPHGEIRRFDTRPGQIRVPILGVALAFAFAMTEFGTVHTAARGSPLADRRKPPHVAGFQHNGQRQDVVNSRDSE